jgi:hypothetical protein
MPKTNRLKRGIQKLQPKWKNEAAGKSFYLFTFGALFMFLSFAAPFWTITDITVPGMAFTLDLVGGLGCADFVVEEGGIWPNDLCCADQKTEDQKEQMEDILKVEPKERSDQQQKTLADLLNIIPECNEGISGKVDKKSTEPKCPDGLCKSHQLCEEKQLPDGTFGKEENCKDTCIINEGKFEGGVQDPDVRACKYYQYGFDDVIAGCTFATMAFGLACAGYALKAATKPAANDLLLTKVFGGLGFAGFLMGLFGIAMFTPGTRGDTANISGGFFLQVVGLCGVLGGVITILDAGQKDLVMPALNFSSFAADEKEKTKVTPAEEEENSV